MPTKKKCPHCNGGIRMSDTFCGRCGKPVTEDSTLPEADTPKTADESVEVLTDDAIRALAYGPEPEDSGAIAPMEEETTHVAPEQSAMAPDPVPTRQEAAADRAYVVEVVTGANQGAIRPIHDDAPVTVGQSRDNTLCLDDVCASRKHAVFTVHDGQVSVADQGSTNGTFLRIGGERPVSMGDEVRVGNTLLRIRAAE